MFPERWDFGGDVGFFDVVAGLDGEVGILLFGEGQVTGIVVTFIGRPAVIVVMKILRL